MLPLGLQLKRSPFVKMTIWKGLESSPFLSGLARADQVIGEMLSNFVNQDVGGNKLDNFNYEIPLR